jgi:hypothetical protein
MVLVDQPQSKQSEQTRDDCEDCRHRPIRALLACAAAAGIAAGTAAALLAGDLWLGRDFLVTFRAGQRIGGHQLPAIWAIPVSHAITSDSRMLDADDIDMEDTT